MKKPSIEIISHCWSSPVVPVFHKMLALQIDSAFRFASDIDVKVTVFCCREDPLTFDILWKMKRPGLWVESVSLSELLRRSIGRNKAALHTTADVVWFADCDHIFLSGCLFSAHRACLESDQQMVHPRYVNINKTHDLGDKLIENFDATSSLDNCSELLNIDDFYPREEKKAIGGIQIVKGDWCREHGYLNDTKWMVPTDPARGWDFGDDVAFRKAVGESKPVDIPNLYRIRHSFSGRDHGTKDHGVKTRK